MSAIMDNLETRAAELEALCPADMDRLALELIGEVPRQARTEKDRKRVVGKLVKAAAEGKQDAVCLLLIAPRKYRAAAEKGLLAFVKQAPGGLERAYAEDMVEEYIAGEIAAGRARLTRDPVTGAMLVAPTGPTAN